MSTHPTFKYLDDALHCESVSLAALAAEFGTPLYVYSAERLRQNYQRVARVFAPLRPLICYAVKANANGALLALLRQQGAGFDIVSGGELHRVLRAGAEPARIVFAGVGKTEAELEMAVQAKVRWINVESQGELERLNAVAAHHRARPTVAIRLRPDVDAATHRHISTGSAAGKFGLPVSHALELVAHSRALPHVHIRGAHIHIGSQLANPQATLQAIEVALDFIAQANARGAEIDTLDLGGGFPVPYRDDDPVPDLDTFAAPIVARLARSGLEHFHVEPGRAIVADTAALLTTVQYEKEDAGHRIVIVDAGMHTLLRPALYEAYHRVCAVAHHSDSPLTLADVAGPICESADFLARAHPLPPLASGDLLALLDVGAYGAAMASNYNSHPLPAEALVEGHRYRLIRRRQTYDDLIANEVIE
ncbi:MAG: diaminopimelate decarboxylase [Chloroflexi bacterium]|nr:diaminopimelate decarboxylase [Chloroflexota bacterium]